MSQATVQSLPTPAACLRAGEGRAPIMRLLPARAGLVLALEAPCSPA